MKRQNSLFNVIKDEDESQPLIEYTTDSSCKSSSSSSLDNHTLIRSRLNYYIPLFGINLLILFIVDLFHCYNSDVSFVIQSYLWGLFISSHHWFFDDEHNNYEIISLGYDYTMILTKQGLLFGCGDNRFGQLGIGTFSENVINHIEPTLTRTMLSPTLKVISVSCGRIHTMILTTDGVYGCGDNTYGQLGIMQSGFISKYDRINIHCRPQRLEKFIHHKKVLSISCGDCYTMILTTDAIYACGYNDDGQLGLGDFENRYYPTKIKYLDEVNILHVSCGLSHTIVFGVNCKTKKNELYGWGNNDNNKLQTWNVMGIINPFKIDLKGELENSGDTVYDIRCFTNFTIMLTRSGKVYITNPKTRGMLNIFIEDKKISDFRTINNAFPFEDRHFSAIFGLSNTLFLLSKNGQSLYAHGNNSVGQLGTYSIHHRYGSLFLGKVYLQLKENEKIIYVKTRDRHTMILTTIGLYTCGDNSKGQCCIRQSMNNDHNTIPMLVNLDEIYL